MPAIFNDENREAMRKNMLEKGNELFKRYGVKSMTVTDIIKSCGLARGTFYTFFPSKEEYIYQVILYRRELVKQKYADMVKEHGQIGRKELMELFLFTRSSGWNYYRYITEQDMNYLSTRWPREYSFNPGADEETIKWLLSHMKGLRSGINWKVLANFMKTLALMDMSKGILHEDALDETQIMLYGWVMNYLFEDVEGT